jgi:PEP-CTERM motif
VTGENNKALYVGTFAAPQLVARTGNAAPGTAAGVNYWDFVSTAALNDAGQVAYLATLTGPDVTFRNNFGLFVADLTGGGLLIAREGNSFDVDPTAGVDLRTIADGGISFFLGRGDDTLTGFSNDGTLAFGLTFTDGTSGIFTAVIPEPASVSLLAIGGLVMARRRR